MMFAGMLRYRLSSETYAQLAHYGMSVIASIASRLRKLIFNLHKRRILLRCTSSRNCIFICHDVVIDGIISLLSAVGGICIHFLKC